MQPFKKYQSANKKYKPGRKNSSYNHINST